MGDIAYDKRRFKSWKAKKYDESVKEMMEDIERRQAEQRPLGKSQLSCAYGNAPYTEAQKIYLPQLDVYKRQGLYQ